MKLIFMYLILYYRLKECLNNREYQKLIKTGCYETYVTSR